MRIQLARHLGVPPDWFDDQPLIWQDWARVSHAVEVDLQTPPETE